MNNSTGTNGPNTGGGWRAPSAGNLPSLPGINSSASERDETNFPPGINHHLAKVLIEKTITSIRSCFIIQTLLLSFPINSSLFERIQIKWEVNSRANDYTNIKCK